MQNLKSNSIILTLAYTAGQNSILSEQIDQLRSNFPSLNLLRNETDRNLISLQTDDDTFDYKLLEKKLSDLGIQLLKTQKQFPVLGMSCSSCALGIGYSLRKLTGIITAEVNYASSILTIEYLPGVTDSQKVHNAVKAMGYDLLRGSVKEEEQRIDEFHAEQLKNLKQKALFSLALCIPIVILGMFAMHWKHSNWIMALLSTPVIFYFGRDYFIRAWKQAIHRKVNMDSLIALSASVAYFSSLIFMLIAHFNSSTKQVDVYFESAAVVIGFLLLGRWMEEKAKKKTNFALQKLMSLKADLVYVESSDGSIREKNVSELAEGDLIVVRPGDKISADGNIVKGSTSIDEQLLSGESMPVYKMEGAEVFAGTINLQGSFRFIATRIGHETILSKIIQLVKQANASKAPIQKRVDQLASIFVPTVIIIALLSFVSWLYFDPSSGFERGLQAFITVLIIACPCALGLATPTALIVGIGKAAQNGILVRDAQSLEAAAKIKTLVLDKTGTLTRGSPVLNNMLWLADEQAYKHILYSLASLSSHPLSKAIAEFFHSKTPLTLDHLSDLVGKGVIAQLNENRFALGSELMMKELDIKLSDQALKFSNHLDQMGESKVLFSKNDQLIAIIGLSDEIRPGAKKLIDDLKGMKLNLILMTGDRKEVAERVSQNLGLQTFEAAMSPEDKIQRIRQFQADGQKVGMVGDGINDSAALAQADLSIAMGSGSDIAKETAGMTILSADINAITKVFNLSKATVSTIRQNLFWAFIYNVVCIPLAAGAFLPLFGIMLDPMYAGMAMALSSLSVLGNSLRLKIRTI